MSEQTSRRKFLSRSGQAAALTTAVAVGGVHTEGAPKREPIRLGIVGCGGMMSGHVKGIVRRKSEVLFTHLCDIDPAQIEKISKHVSGFQSAEPKRTGHYEEVVQDKNVDAVIIATPHHWHTPIALLAMEAGKDVYIEKPISHVYEEGTRIVAAAEKYGCVVQHGTQMRSSPVTRQAGELLKSGIIGEIKVARAWTAELREVVKPLPDGEPPANVDYDRWIGPAPERPFNSHRFHFWWRVFRDYGNGEIGDDGIHDIDMARWGLGDPRLPVQVTARGGRTMLFGHISEYPDNLVVTYEYPDGGLLVYENYPFTQYGMHGFDNGNVFYGTEGYMVFSRRGAFQVFLGAKGKPGPTEDRAIRTNKGYAEHMDDFLDAVRTRSKTNAGAEISHHSSALVHLGEIAYLTKGRLQFDTDHEQFVDCDEANALLTKKYRAPYAKEMTKS